MTLPSLFHGERVKLTALKPEDAPVMLHWYENGEFARLWDSRPARPSTENQLVRWIEERAKHTETYDFAIRLKENGELIGYVELDDIEWPHQTAWLSVGIGDPANRGQGYGYEATEMVLRFAFHELNLHRVQLTVFSYNEAAIKLYERAGFVREGTFREFLQRDGKRHDMYLCGLLRSEWEEQIR
jgi:RimJ/RimL family protein N-acetyltransferase